MSDFLRSYIRELEELHKERLAGEDDVIEIYKENLTVENCEELAKVMFFLKENNFSTEFLEDNTEDLCIQIDTAMANSGAADKGVITIKSEKNTGCVIHEMFHLASTEFLREDEVYSGIQDGNVGTALNEGITDYLAKFVDPSFEIQYELESMVAGKIIEKYGFGILQGYFNADSEEFLESFSVTDREVMVDIIDHLDFYEENLGDDQAFITSIIKLNEAFEKLGIEKITFGNENTMQR